MKNEPMTNCYGWRIQEGFDRRVDRAVATANTVWLIVSAYLLFRQWDPGPVNLGIVDIPIFAAQILFLGLWNSRRWTFSVMVTASLWGVIACLLLFVTTGTSFSSFWVTLFVLANGGWGFYRLQVTA